MRYLEWRTDGDLARDLECIWMLADEATTAYEPVRVFPDGCIELVVHLGTPFESPVRGLQPGAFVVGQLSAPLHLVPRAGFDTVAARFRPGAAPAWFGASLDELADAAVPLDTLWGRAASASLVGRLRGARGRRARVREFLGFLVTRRRAHGEAHASTRSTVDLVLRRRGIVRVADLARDARLSERQLERRFAREIGCGPLQFARTVRFQHVLAQLEDGGGTDWAGLAWDCGFFDQSHLIREVRAFTGATPERLRDAALEFARRFTTRERLAAYFAPAHRD